MNPAELAATEARFKVGDITQTDIRRLIAAVRCAPTVEQVLDTAKRADTGFDRVVSESVPRVRLDWPQSMSYEDFLAREE